MVATERSSLALASLSELGGDWSIPGDGLCSSVNRGRCQGSPLASRRDSFTAGKRMKACASFSLVTHLKHKEKGKNKDQYQRSLHKRMGDTSKASTALGWVRGAGGQSHHLATKGHKVTERSEGQRGKNAAPPRPRRRRRQRAQGQVSLDGRVARVRLARSRRQHTPSSSPPALIHTHTHRTPLHAPPSRCHHSLEGVARRPPVMRCVASSSLRR